MQDTHLFEYAVIRVVPRVDREEFLNVGVILYCPPLRYLDLICTRDYSKLLALDPTIDVGELEKHLDAFGAITRGEAAAGPIGRMDIAGRFRWLTATRSTVLQTSKVHPGLCGDPRVTIVKLFEDLVL
ncbi:MAG TPA: DUF3037 domain-containing protein [Puia sp.]|nr:DUF3037 domain-containing protein [Puia sp.]